MHLFHAPVRRGKLYLGLYTYGFTRLVLVWPLLNKSKTTRPLAEAKQFFGQRRSKNLSDHLVRASTKTLDNHTHHIDLYPCKRPNSCRYCPLLDTSGSLVSTTTGKTFKSRQKINCQSANVIYVITCRNCGIQYVGQTKNRILIRFQGHFSDIAHDNDTTVARHFNRCPSESPLLERDC